MQKIWKYLSVVSQFIVPLMFAWIIYNQANHFRDSSEMFPDLPFEYKNLMQFYLPFTIIALSFVVLVFHLISMQIDASKMSQRIEKLEGIVGTKEVVSKDDVSHTEVG